MDLYKRKNQIIHPISSDNTKFDLTWAPRNVTRYLGQWFLPNLGKARPLSHMRFICKTTPAPHPSSRTLDLVSSAKLTQTQRTTEERDPNINPCPFVSGCSNKASTLLAIIFSLTPANAGIEHILCRRFCCFIINYYDLISTLRLHKCYFKHRRRRSIGGAMGVYADAGEDNLRWI